MTAKNATPRARVTGKTTGRIAGAALIVMIGTVFSRFVAIPRESLIASMFGDAVVTNSFTIAENVLTIFLDLLLSGIASAVLVPVLSEYVGEDQRDALGRARRQAADARRRRWRGDAAPARTRRARRRVGDDGHRRQRRVVTIAV